MGKYNGEVYLRAEHLLRDGKYLSPKVEIEDVLTGCPLQRKQKPFEGFALKFKGTEKVLGLGLTNENLCTVVCGDSRHESWIGKKIQLEVRECRSPTGGTTPAIRIIPEKGTVMRSGLIKELGKPYG